MLITRALLERLLKLPAGVTVEDMRILPAAEGIIEVALSGPGLPQGGPDGMTLPLVQVVEETTMAHFEVC